jgi:hypothetical protein
VGIYFLFNKKELIVSTLNSLKNIELKKYFEFSFDSKIAADENENKVFSLEKTEIFYFSILSILSLASFYFAVKYNMPELSFIGLFLIVFSAFIVKSNTLFL